MRQARPVTQAADNVDTSSLAEYTATSTLVVEIRIEMHSPIRRIVSHTFAKAASTIVVGKAALLVAAQRQRLLRAHTSSQHTKQTKNGKHSKPLQIIHKCASRVSNNDRNDTANANSYNSLRNTPMSTNATENAMRTRVRQNSTEYATRTSIEHVNVPRETLLIGDTNSVLAKN